MEGGGGVRKREKESVAEERERNNGCDKDAANIIESDREGDSPPAGAAEHRRQLQQSRQGHSQTRRRCFARLHLQGHR